MSPFSKMAVAVLLATPAHAFVVTPSPLAQTTNTGAASYVTTQKEPFSGTPTTAPTPRDDTALSMDISDRLGRVAWANLNEAAKKLDPRPPEMLLDQALSDMQNDLVRIQQAFSESVDTQKRMILQKEQYEATAAKWRRRAQNSLSRGYERRAKEELFQRQKYLEAATKVKEDIEVRETVSEKLYIAMNALQTKFRDGLARKQALEAVADASFGVLGGDQEHETVNEGRIDMEFAKLEGLTAIEEEFEKIKEEIRKKQSVASSSASMLVW